MSKKIKIGILFLVLFIIGGCSSKTDPMEENSIDKSKYQTSDLSFITCRRDTETEDDSKVEITYQIYYNEDRELEILKSLEEVRSSHLETLKKYKDAYLKIYSVYEGLDYYDHEVIEEEGMIRSITYINYGKIDMNQLMKIEGYEDNVKVVDGKIKLEDWKSFAKKYGTSCSS